MSETTNSAEKAEQEPTDAAMRHSYKAIQEVNALLRQQNAELRARNSELCADKADIEAKSKILLHGKDEEIADLKTALEVEQGKKGLSIGGSEPRVYGRMHREQ